MYIIQFSCPTTILVPRYHHIIPGCLFILLHFHVIYPFLRMCLGFSFFYKKLWKMILISKINFRILFPIPGYPILVFNPTRISHPSLQYYQNITSFSSILPGYPILLFYPTRIYHSCLQSHQDISSFSLILKG